MSNCEKNSCGNPCGGCTPAHYSQGFGQSNGLYGQGNPTRDNVRQFETDTSLSIDNSNATLVYKGEKHTDKITGQQLGSIININDLRDVDLDYNFDALCGEFIYHRYGECGDGCRSLQDSWNMFSIDQDGAKQNSIRYVRGANAYGCPIYLDTPSNELQYWYAGWTPTGEHCYYQPKPVTDLPTDADGNPIAVSQDPVTKQPLVGPVKIQEYLDQSECTYFDPVPGFTAQGGGNSFCYYPKQGTANIILDLICTTARPAQVCFDVHVATIHDPRFWPQLDSGYIDLPLHCVFENNSDGKIMPIWLRIDNQGRLLVTGEMTARPTSGKAAYMVIGVDDSISWLWKG